MTLSAFSILLFALIATVQVTNAGWISDEHKRAKPPTPPPRICQPRAGVCLDTSYRVFDRCNDEGTGYYRGRCSKDFICYEGNCFPSGMPETYMDANLLTVFDPQSMARPTTSLTPSLPDTPPSDPIPFVTDVLTPHDLISRLDDILSIEDPTLLYRDLIVMGNPRYKTMFTGTQIETGQRVMIKQIHFYDQLNNEVLINEILMLKHSRHENIIKFVDAYRHGVHVWIVMEYVDGVQLKDVIDLKQLNEPQIAAVCRGILHALSYVHALGIIHRDIRSENVILSNQGQVKLMNFDLCAYKNDHRNKGIIPSKSAYWMSPEMVTSKEYGLKIDIWSFGILIYEMIERNPPYYYPGPISIVEWVDRDGATTLRNPPRNFSFSPMFVIELIARNGAPTLKNPGLLSDALRDFLGRCLEVDVEKRSSAEELLQHSFLSQTDPLVPLMTSITKRLEMQG